MAFQFACSEILRRYGILLFVTYLIYGFNSSKNFFFITIEFIKKITKNRAYFAGSYDKNRPASAIELYRIKKCFECGTRIRRADDVCGFEQANMLEIIWKISRFLRGFVGILKISMKIGQRKWWNRRYIWFKTTNKENLSEKNTHQKI